MTTARTRRYESETLSEEARILPTLAYAVFEIVEPPYPMLAARTCVAWCHTERDACRIRDALQARHGTPTPEQVDESKDSFPLARVAG